MSSRRAACSGDSPASMPPPGGSHLVDPSKGSRKRSKRIRPWSSRQMIRAEGRETLGSTAKIISHPVPDDFVKSMPGRRNIGDVGEHKTDGSGFVVGRVRRLPSRVPVWGALLDEGLNELLQSGIGGVPVAGLVHSEVDTLEPGIREASVFLSDPFGRELGEEGGDTYPAGAFDRHGPPADADRTKLVENIDDVGGEEQPLALGELAEPAAVLLHLTDPGPQ